MEANILVMLDVCQVFVFLVLMCTRSIQTDLPNMYAAIPPVFFETGCSEQVEIHTERRGVIYSPSWPLNYPAGVNCSWHIQGGQGEVITIR